MARIGCGSRLSIVAASGLVLAGLAGTARAQLNNGVGIGPSTELERPDLQRKEAKAPARGAATRAQPMHASRARMGTKAGTTPRM